jgi:RNA recognition motif-containing protein
MGRRLYVGNLPYKVTDDDLSQLFGQAGAVESVRVMRDVATGRARGFAFVQMASDEAAQTAIAQFHQYQLDGRPLVVNEARPKPEGEGGGLRAPRYDQGERGGGRGGDARREPRW